MSEKKQQLEALLKVCAVVIFSLLYALGGLEGITLGVRRYAAPLFLAGATWYFTRDWKMVIGLPLQFGSLSLGYGADLLFIKIMKRLAFGLANGLSFSIGNLLNRRWIWSGFYMGLVTVGTVVLGVFNPLPNARTEEMVIGLLIGLTIMNTRRKS